MDEVNYAHQRELVHLVCARDLAEHANEPKEVREIEKRIEERYGYKTRSLKEVEGQMNAPRLVK